MRGGIQLKMRSAEVLAWCGGGGASTAGEGLAPPGAKKVSGVRQLRYGAFLCDLL